MLDCHSVSTPLEPGIQLRKGQPKKILDDPTLYQSIRDSLMYARVGTRPDLAHMITLPVLFISKSKSPKSS